MANEGLPGFFEVTNWKQTPRPDLPPPTPSDNDLSVDRFVFHQDTPADPWVIVHNLNRIVHVVPYDSDGNAIDAGVKLDNNTQATVTFGTPVAGYAVCI